MKENQEKGIKMFVWLKERYRKLDDFLYAHVLDYDIDWSKKKAIKTRTKSPKTFWAHYCTPPILFLSIASLFLLWGSGMLTYYIDTLPDYIEMLFFQKELVLHIAGSDPLTEGEAMRYIIFHTFVWITTLIFNFLSIIILIYFAYSIRSTPDNIEFNTYEDYRDFFKNKIRAPSKNTLLIAFLTWPVVYQLEDLSEMADFADLNFNIFMLYLILPLLLILLLTLGFIINYREKKRFRENIITHYSGSTQTPVPEFISTKRFIEKDLSIKILDKKFVLAIFLLVFNHNTILQFFLNSLKFILP